MARPPNRVAGVAYLRVNGIQYALRGNLTINIENYNRGEPIAGLDGVHGYKETPTVPSISADISDLGGLSLEALRAMNNETVTAELGNGKTYILRNAWTGDAMELNVADGQITVKWYGMRGEELMSAA